MIPLIATLFAAVGFGERDVIVGVAVKFTLLLTTPPAVTFTGPVTALAGTVVDIEVLLQERMVPTPPLKLTDPFVVPNPEPAIVKVVPVVAEFGLIEVMFKVELTVKVVPLLATLPAVTMMFPVVAPEGTGRTIWLSLQLVGLPAVPLKVIVAPPWFAPNPLPLIVTIAPIPPVVGVELRIHGPAVTVKVALLLPPLFT